jgi:hypothetical protein
MGVNFRSMVFGATTTLNFVLSDGTSLYVFKNSRYDPQMHNLSYNIIDGRFIGIKTQDRLDNQIERNQLVIIDQFGNITTTLLDISLPVELAFFNGTVALDGTVTMSWQTASETGMSGFNIYRGDTSNFPDALQLNAQLIIATNNASGSNYQFIDAETLPGDVYHYWLECMDSSGAVAHVAYIIVTIPNHNDPNVPPVSTTCLLPNFPNPFQSGSVTNIPVHIRSGDFGSLTIHNIKGQMIRDYGVSAGISNLIWDGRNSQGNLCAPGIYLTLLKTKNSSIARKVIMTK